MSDLICPITLELLDDPITLPCCQQCVSRAAMITCLMHSENCPMCRASLYGFNVNTATSPANFRSIVDAARTAMLSAQGTPAVSQQVDSVNLPINPPIDPTTCWKATITKLSQHQFSLDKTKTVAKLQILNCEIVNKNLVIPVIDLSGSMSGRATVQVIDAAKYILDATYINKNLITSIVTYNHSAQSINIDTSRSKHFYLDIINRFSSNGGTSFKAAFDKLLEVIKLYADSDIVTCASIIFLTDGEDSSVDKNKRADLVSQLKCDIESVWKKDYTVHSIGFGSYHDSNFLQSLRLIGTSEGAYRYASPSECDDELFSKIVSVVNVLSTQTVTPIVICESENMFTIKSGSAGVYWIEGVIGDCIPVSFNYQSNRLTVDAEVTESEQLWREWYTKLIDDIASELVSLTSGSAISCADDLGQQLHLELLTRRCQAISVRLPPDSSDTDRLEKLKTTIENIRKGISVDKVSLLDMKYEGQFATVTKSRNIEAVKVANVANTPSIKQPKPKKEIVEKPWKIVKIDKNNFIHVSGNTALHFAALNGAVSSITNMLNESEFNLDEINKINSNGFTALDVAIVNGYWISVEILIKAGAVTNINGTDLLMTCLSKYYVNTSKLLVENGISVADKKLADLSSCMTAKTWLIDHSKYSYDIETAIVEQLQDVVKSKISTVDTVNIETISKIFTYDTDKSLEIIKLLIDENKIDIKKVFKSNEDETTALFTAAEKGAIKTVQLLLPYLDKSDLDWQNGLGTTAVWISSCNRHADLLCELINAGADINIVNNKGDSALIPACQKGSVTVANILIETGIDLNAHNQNRDNCVLICCRNGQAEILDMLLSRMDKSILDFYAEIDGFTPLLAATELCKLECIKVCIKYGADQNWRTLESNKVIQGATALHLACFYGKLDAVKLLIQSGSDIKAKTSYDGQTCLHIAINAGYSNVVGFLIHTDPSLIDIPDNFNKLPVHYATSTGREDIINTYFTDRLAELMSFMLSKYNDQYGNIIDAYGESNGVFSCKEVINKNLGNGETLYTRALMSGDTKLISKLESLGADITIADDYGITPAFWKSVLYGSDVTDNTTADYVEKLNKFKNSSIQNKMLLLTSNIKKECSTNFSTVLPLTSLETEMSCGFNTKCNPKTLNLITKSNETSILTFLDKLTKAKIFPDGTACLSKLLFDAKINMIKLIVSANEPLLQPLYQIALYLYTGNSTINNQVCATLQSFDEKNIWIPFIVCLYKAVNSAPVYNFEVYRAVKTVFDPEQYKIGINIQWNCFSTCTKDWKLTTYQIAEKSGIIFIVKSKSARDISRYAHNPANGEVVFLPGSSFTVTAIYKADQITLAQANIRAQTFTAKETDIYKASQSKSTIIVELTE